jgi:hypothetical protein
MDESVDVPYWAVLCVTYYGGGEYDHNWTWVQTIEEAEEHFDGYVENGRFEAVYICRVVREYDRTFDS